MVVPWVEKVSEVIPRFLWRLICCLEYHNVQKIVIQDFSHLAVGFGLVMNVYVGTSVRKLFLKFMLTSKGRSISFPPYR